MIVYFFSECQKKDDRIKKSFFVRSRNDQTFLAIVKKSTIEYKNSSFVISQNYPTFFLISSKNSMNEYKKVICESSQK